MRSKRYGLKNTACTATVTPFNQVNFSMTYLTRPCTKFNKMSEGLILYHYYTSQTSATARIEYLNISGSHISFRSM